MLFVLVGIYRLMLNVDAYLTIASIMITCFSMFWVLEAPSTMLAVVSTGDPFSIHIFGIPDPDLPDIGIVWYGVSCQFYLSTVSSKE